MASVAGQELVRLRRLDGWSCSKQRFIQVSHGDGGEGLSYSEGRIEVE